MTLAISLVVLFFSIVIHEVAHGSMALHLGDPTAKNAGRLTLNPLKHIDPFGTILLPIITFVITAIAGRGLIFGMAKPVPVNPFYFKDKKWGNLKVSIVGPAANFLLAFIFGMIIRFFVLPEGMTTLFAIVVFYNLLWGMFNLVPIPPLDGSHILFTFLPDRFMKAKIFMQQHGFLILIIFLFTFGLQLLGDLSRYAYFFITGHPPVI